MHQIYPFTLFYNSNKLNEIGNAHNGHIHCNEEVNKK